MCCHAAAVIALFLILWKMTGTLWRSAFVTALFAIHPLRVESVAWIAAIQDRGTVVGRACSPHVRRATCPRAVPPYGQPGGVCPEWHVVKLALCSSGSRPAACGKVRSPALFNLRLHPLARSHSGGTTDHRAIRQSYRRPLACPEGRNIRTGNVLKRLN